MTTNNSLDWPALVPDNSPYQAIFNHAEELEQLTFDAIQPRLENSITLFCHPQSSVKFMLLKAEETHGYLSLISGVVAEQQSDDNPIIGSRYHITGHAVMVEQATDSNDNFSSRSYCQYFDWIEPEQLFGAFRIHHNAITLEPGAVHQCNGGVLILSLRTLLAQPLMWLRLKKMVNEGCYRWISPDETRPLPVTIPPMPLNLRVILVGDRLSLADFSEIEPEICEQTVYGEFEHDLTLTSEEDMTLWCRYVKTLLNEHQLPALHADAWPVLVRNAIRYSGDQAVLPLCPEWLLRQLGEAALYTENEQISGQDLINASTARDWRESYLAERMQDEIELGQILIATEGEVVGQINGLSVLDYPGHPRACGEPSRISCVVHVGDGELTDVERKAELGGNLHAKGMMIMQAFLISELELESNLPFSASIVFEQSYGEVDGDSASLAGLAAFISALSLQPIKQSIAVTGSVDQFGNVQPIGGVNEKIEGYFEVCKRRGLTGEHGVIIPASNIRNLCLNDDVVSAVKEGLFHLWPVEQVADALPILTGVAYAEEGKPCLLSAIIERIATLTAQDRSTLPWIFRWLNWFNQR